MLGYPVPRYSFMACIWVIGRVVVHLLLWPWNELCSIAFCFNLEWDIFDFLLVLTSEVSITEEMSRNTPFSSLPCRALASATILLSPCFVIDYVLHLSFLAPFFLDKNSMVSGAIYIYIWHLMVKEEIFLLSHKNLML